MLSNSTVVVTEHYPDGLDPDVTFGINEPSEKPAMKSARFYENQ